MQLAAGCNRALSRRLVFYTQEQERANAPTPLLLRTLLVFLPEPTMHLFLFYPLLTPQLCLYSLDLGHVVFLHLKHPMPPTGSALPGSLHTLKPCSLLLTVLTNPLISCGMLHRLTGSDLQEGRLGVYSPGTASASRSGLTVSSCGLK